jgi:ankyrin repeat protein
MLISKGANVNHVTRDGSTPLSVANGNRRDGIILLLKENGAREKHLKKDDLSGPQRNSSVPSPRYDPGRQNNPHDRDAMFFASGSYIR